MNKELQDAIDAQVKAMVTLELERQKDTKTIELTRKMRIEQKKAGFRSASDKRSVGFLYDVKFDLEDFYVNFKKVVDDDDNVKDLEGNADNVKEFIKFCSSFGNKLNRKVMKEIEGYEVAKTSKYGWLSEKYYRQTDLFNDFDPEEQKWYERDEPSAEDKVKKLRQAEKQAALNLRQKKSWDRRFDQPKGRKRTRWGHQGESSASSSAAATVTSNDVKYGSMNLYQPPAYRSGNNACHYCGEVGHYIRQCPKKPAKN